MAIPIQIKIIGTSHIAKESLDKVRKEFKEFKPEIIGLELDIRRFQALQSNDKRISFSMIRHVGMKGFLFAAIAAWAEKKLGEVVGVSPGSEMLLAAKLAKKEKIPIAFIDQDIEITLTDISKVLTWKEKWHFVVDMVSAMLQKKEVQFDLTKVPEKEIIQKLLEHTKKRYPNIYYALVTKRNRYMAKKIVQLIIEQPGKKILVLIGAGHEDEMHTLIEKNMEKVSHNKIVFTSRYDLIL